ncbi:hypothetical protein N9933_02050 [bacterium]|nr:hypothetical protein [bacterium]
MKKSLIILSFGLILLFGCNPEPPTPIGVSLKNQNPETLSYTFNFDGETPVWEAGELSESFSNLSDNTALKKGNSAHAHGTFSLFGGLFTTTFSATENNGGTHGAGVFTQVAGPPFNVPADVVMETACISVEGNVAAYAGTITEVIENGGWPVGNGPFEVGNTIYFTVKDNGASANAPLDQYAPFIIITVGPTTDCPNFLFPEELTNFWLDVGSANDKIKVN